jgi:hypothetical protein
VLQESNTEKLDSHLTFVTEADLQIEETGTWCGYASGSTIVSGGGEEGYLWKTTSEKVKHDVREVGCGI